MLSEKTPKALGIGLPRSGTHTIAQSWTKKVASHEALDKIVVALLMDYLSGNLSDRQLQNRLRCRWRIANVDFDVFHAMHHFLDALPDTDKPRHFVLTVREPTLWFKSELNQNFRTREMPSWATLEQYRYGRYELPVESWDSDELRAYTRWPIRAYFRYWNDHIVKVFRSVDKGQLLVGKTEMLPGFLFDIADFCGFDRSLVRTDFHGGKGTQYVPESILPKIDVLREIASQECIPALQLLDEAGINFSSDM